MVVQSININFKEVLKNVIVVMGTALILFSLFSSVANPKFLMFIAGSLGMKKVKLIAIIRKAYSLYKAGKSIRTAISLATGGWGFAITLIANAGLAFLVSNLNNPIITF